jgi:CheY-like chemotaxis protein
MPNPNGRPSPLNNHQHLAKEVPLRILIAEDNLVNQKVISKVLKRLGYQADMVNNGQEVLKAFDGAFYDLVLMDVQMPEMDGLSAARHLRQTFSDQKQPWIIAITANALNGDRELCLAAGMNDYLTKPLQVEALIGAIYRIKAMQSF